MGSQQIMEFLLAMQAKADTRHEQMMADWKAWQEGPRCNGDKCKRKRGCNEVTEDS
jgi:hypothetical protein